LFTIIAIIALELIISANVLNTRLL